MRYRLGFITAVLAAALIAAPAAACCVSEYGAPHTQPVRGLVHQIAVAALRCGGVGTRAAMDRACARRDQLMDRARRMGWCWGSRDPDAADFQLYWLRCSKDRSLSWQPTK
ncbi:MAG: hypothetical protein JWO81_1404 [Alphaproteobacteria bacterium]|nr:hypothetical protein [Alphaproteobacteria bacterium]